ncbi:MAG: ParB N-terminal domain-containing protein [Rhodocyclaceae bacterium]|nr:ParB N-terminal domain-containing protein [Rhodocyclaceae bacterium]
MKKRVLSPAIPLPPYQAGAETSATRAHAHDADAPGVNAEYDHERDLRLISVECIDPNPYAPRVVYTPEMILKIATGLREQGQNDAIHVIPHPDIPGRYIIADGWTRVQACRIHKVADQLWAQVHHGMTAMEAGAFGYRQNETRNSHTDYDRAMFFERLIEGGMSPSEVADAYGITRQMLHLYRAFAKLPEELSEVVRAHPERFGPVAANELLKLASKAGVNRAVTTAMQFVDEDRSVRWLVSRVQALCEPRKDKGPPLVRQIRYANGYFKQRGDRFELSIDVPPELREEFASQVETLLTKVARPLQPEHEQIAVPTDNADVKSI